MKRKLPTAAPSITRAKAGLLALIAGSAGALTSAAHAQYVWVSPTAGTFSTGANWQGNVPPPLSNPATSLTFTQGNTAAITATNDLGTPFVASALTFNVANSLTVAGSVAANAFQLVGPAPSITLSGNGSATLSATGANLQLAGPTTISGSGLGGLTISGAITQSGTQSLTISGAAALPCWRMVTLGSGANTFSGGLNLNGGTVQTAGFGAGTFGAAGSTLTVDAVNGGVIASTANLSNGVSLGKIQLNGTLRFIGATVSMSLSTASTAVALEGSGALVFNHASSTGLTISSDSPLYQGTVTIDRASLPNFTGNAGGLALSAVGGSATNRGALINVPSFDVRAGGTLNVSNGATNSLQNGNRIGDTTPINLRSGNLTLTGAAATGAAGFIPASLAETIGDLRGAGYALVTATPGTASGVSTTLSARSLARVDRGTFLFRGTNLGDSVFNTRGVISFYQTTPSADLVGGAGAPGSTSISILPYAIGDITGTGTGTSLVTYDAAGGIRPLNLTTEYAADLLSGPTTNARLTGATANGANATLNALVLGGGSITGSAMLNVTSGTILNTTAGASISNDVNFAAREGQLFTPAAMTISGALQGSGGLTKSGTGTLTLSGSNSGLTGPLTINAGAISIPNAAALPGGAADPIIASGTGGGVAVNGVGITYTGAAPLDISRPITIGGGLFNPVSTTAGVPLTLSGQISGAGGVFVSTTGDVVLSGTNTYTGPTALGGGNLHISSDVNLGNGGGLNLATSATTGLILDGAWTTSRHVNVSGPTLINTQGFTATLNGPMSGFIANGLTQSTTAAITKTGSGTLVLNGAQNTYTGPITVSSGTLLVNGELAASLTSAVTVSSTATLGGSGIINRNVNVSSGGTLAPGNSPGILTVNGAVALVSGSAMSMELNGPLAGYGAGDSDLLMVNGTVSLGGASLSAALGYPAAIGSTFWLIANDGSDAVTGTFAGLNEGDLVSLGTVAGNPFTAQISYTGNFTTGLVNGSGNDVVLYNVVPAPGAAAACLGLGALVMTRRRRAPR